MYYRVSWTYVESCSSFKACQLIVILCRRSTYYMNTFCLGWNIVGMLETDLKKFVSTCS